MVSCHVISIHTDQTDLHLPSCLLLGNWLVLGMLGFVMDCAQEDKSFSFWSCFSYASIHSIPYLNRIRQLGGKAENI